MTPEANYTQPQVGYGGTERSAGLTALETVSLVTPEPGRPFSELFPFHGHNSLMSLESWLPGPFYRQKNWGSGETFCAKFCDENLLDLDANRVLSESRT